MIIYTSEVMNKSLIVRANRHACRLMYEPKDDTMLVYKHPFYMHEFDMYGVELGDNGEVPQSEYMTPVVVHADRVAHIVSTVYDYLQVCDDVHANVTIKMANHKGDGAKQHLHDYYKKRECNVIFGCLKPWLYGILDNTNHPMRILRKRTYGRWFSKSRGIFDDFPRSEIVRMVEDRYYFDYKVLMKAIHISKDTIPYTRAVRNCIKNIPAHLPLSMAAEALVKWHDFAGDNELPPLPKIKNAWVYMNRYVRGDMVEYIKALIRSTPEQYERVFKMWNDAFHTGYSGKKTIDIWLSSGSMLDMTNPQPHGTIISLVQSSMVAHQREERHRASIWEKDVTEEMFYVPVAVPKDAPFKQLMCSDELHKEGIEMSHCVGGYHTRCLQGDSVIFAFPAEKLADRATVEFSPMRNAVVQSFGPHDHITDASKKAAAVINKWAQGFSSDDYLECLNHYIEGLPEREQSQAIEWRPQTRHCTVCNTWNIPAEHGRYRPNGDFVCDDCIANPPRGRHAYGRGETPFGQGLQLYTFDMSGTAPYEEIPF